MADVGFGAEWLAAILGHKDHDEERYRTAPELTGFVLAVIVSYVEPGQLRVSRVRWGSL